MRNPKNNNRNNNHHRRGGGGRRYNNNGGGGNRNNDGQNVARQKHHATQMLGKYSDLMRNAQINGDRVDVEYYLQHIDHYTRVLTDIAVIEAERHAQFREQQIAAGVTESSDAAGDNADGSGGDAPVEVQQSHQPRMTRPHYRRSPQPAEDNGAADANANTSEIPLPGGILPPV